MINEQELINDELMNHYFKLRKPNKYELPRMQLYDCKHCKSTISENNRTEHLTKYHKEKTTHLEYLITITEKNV